jgi:regulator of replication initiation timing
VSLAGSPGFFCSISDMIDNIPIISYIVNMKDEVEKSDLIKIIEDLRKEIVELKRDNTLLSYDVATLTDRIKEMESNAKR